MKNNRRNRKLIFIREKNRLIDFWRGYFRRMGSSTFHSAIWDKKTLTLHLKFTPPTPVKWIELPVHFAKELGESLQQAATSARDFESAMESLP
jgi:hypothetical protein